MAGILLACTVAMPAVAKIVLWKKVNGWNVAVDPSMGNGCFIGSLFEGGFLVRIGLDRIDNVAYLTVGNKEWKSIEEGKRYPVTLELGNDSPWSAQAIGTRLDDLPTLLFTTRDPDFVIDFKVKRSVALHYEKKEIAALSLKGSSAAIDALLDCQAAANAMTSGEPRRPAPGRPKDPFETGASRPASDPFRL